jgi:hypothetical protein
MVPLCNLNGHAAQVLKGGDFLRPRPNMAQTGAVMRLYVLVCGEILRLQRPRDFTANRAACSSGSV